MLIDYRNAGAHPIGPAWAPPPRARRAWRSVRRAGHRLGDRRRGRSAIGAVAGGLAGKGLAEVIDPTSKARTGRAEYRHRKYYDLRPSITTAISRRRTLRLESSRSSAIAHEDIEDQTPGRWKEHRGQSRWNGSAQHAVHDAGAGSSRSTL